jgi:hypothetical protein
MDELGATASLGAVSACGWMAARLTQDDLASDAAGCVILPGVPAARVA